MLLSGKTADGSCVEMIPEAANLEQTTDGEAVDEVSDGDPGLARVNT